MPVAFATPPRTPDQTVECEILVAGGGLAGAATAYESLLAGKTVCLSEITDWVGGQISSQGTSALDEIKTQRQLLYYPRGYVELRRRIQNYYGELNPGHCWVSVACFIPRDAHRILFSMLQDAAKRGKGTLKWFPNTAIKELEINPSGHLIAGAIAIQHRPTPSTPPLNTEPLSQTIEDSYRYENSPRFEKTIVHFVPKSAKSTQKPKPVDWYVVDATETGELIALADVPYHVGIDARSYADPSSSSVTQYSFCTQAFTYTFAMEATKDSQPHTMPSFYPEYEPYYSYEDSKYTFAKIFTYRRIWGHHQSFDKISLGDISMQNWGSGNDYAPGTAGDNLVYDRSELQATGQLEPGKWMGGLRVESLHHAEELAMGYFYWLVAGTTDSQLGVGVKKPYPNNRYLTGLDSPMGTMHGLSKYPYIREGRRIIGRPAWGYPQGLSVTEIDISRHNFRNDYYQKTLSQSMYRSLQISLAGLNIPAVLSGHKPLEDVKLRTRSTIYPDSVGIGFYAIDFHPCMTKQPPEANGNTEREGERQAAGLAYPFQIPLRTMIPQKIDNMLVAGKSIATSHIAAAAYRVHSFEWSSGAAAGTTAAFALSQGVMPYQLVDELPRAESQLELLQRQLINNGNPIAFPNTSIFNQSWDNWKN